MEESKTRRRKWGIGRRMEESRNEVYGGYTQRERQWERTEDMARNKRTL